MPPRFAARRFLISLFNRDENDVILLKSQESMLPDASPLIGAHASAAFFVRAIPIGSTRAIPRIQSDPSRFERRAGSKHIELQIHVLPLLAGVVGSIKLGNDLRT